MNPIFVGRKDFSLGALHKSTFRDLKILTAILYRYHLGTFVFYFYDHYDLAHSYNT